MPDAANAAGEEESAEDEAVAFAGDRAERACRARLCVSSDLPHPAAPHSRKPAAQASERVWESMQAFLAHETNQRAI